jgi:hypothetical protein
MDNMSVAEQPEHSRLVVVEPGEGLRRALPVPTVGELTDIEATDDEWARFYKALSER